jgi:hypothetical protein
MVPFGSASSPTYNDPRPDVDGIWFSGGSCKSRGRPFEIWLKLKLREEASTVGQAAMLTQ